MFSALPLVDIPRHAPKVVLSDARVVLPLSCGRGLVGFSIGRCGLTEAVENRQRSPMESFQEDALCSLEAMPGSAPHPDYASQTPSSSISTRHTLQAANDSCRAAPARNLPPPWIHLPVTRWIVHSLI